MDLVNNYDCNCEEGYPRSYRDGEIVCGDSRTDEVICSGHTCGAYGVCINLKGRVDEFERPRMNATAAQAEHKSKHGGDRGDRGGHNFGNSEYRCECTHGYYDNGKTCVQRDCGKLEDKLGVWVGSTLTGGEYTLTCPPGAYVWGGALQEITVNCGTGGDWLSRPICVNPAMKRRTEEFARVRFWLLIAVVVLCIVSAALAAGLTLGLVSLDPFGLAVIIATQESDCKTFEERDKLSRDKTRAQQMLPLVRDHHMLLVTLLLSNTVANEALPVFLDELVPSWGAVLLSVTVVLICGEILPSVLFTGTHRFAMAAAFVPCVGRLQMLLYPIARPIARLLDYLIHEDQGSKYNRAALRALLQLHGPRGSGDEQLEPEANQSEPGARGGHAFAAGQNKYSALACCSTGSKAEAAHPAKKPAGGDAVLTTSELRMLDGTLELRRNVIRRTLNGENAVDYADVRHCILAGMSESAAAVVARRGFHKSKHGKSAVLIVSEPEKQVLTLGDVCGCLRPQDLLRGGGKTLEELRQPWATVLCDQTAVDALEAMARSGSSLGVVVSGDSADSHVRGVVTSTDLLRYLFCGPGMDPSKRGGGTQNGLTRTGTRSSEDLGQEPRQGGKNPPMQRRPLPAGLRLHRARTAGALEVQDWHDLTAGL